MASPCGPNWENRTAHLLPVSVEWRAKKQLKFTSQFLKETRHLRARCRQGWVFLEAPGEHLLSCFSPLLQCWSWQLGACGWMVLVPQHRFPFTSLLELVASSHDFCPHYIYKDLFPFQVRLLHGFWGLGVGCIFSLQAVWSLSGARDWV